MHSFYRRICFHFQFRISIVDFPFFRISIFLLLCPTLGILRVFFPQIRIAIEIAEHEQHKHILYCHYECYQFRIIAVILENDLHEMQDKQQKLNHLHLCDVFLPPNGSLDILVECADQIVAVHDGMHQTIEHTDHRTMPGRQKTYANPYAEHHGAVVIHMQKCYVCETFAHHKKYLKIKITKFNNDNQCDGIGRVCHCGTHCVQ